MTIDRICESDIPETARMIARAVRSPSFAAFYPACSLEYVIEGLDEPGVRRLMAETHLYVAREAGRVVGCGGVGPLGGRADECVLRAVFVDPDDQGRGYGSNLVRALEADAYARRAKRIEISASISAIPFYRKLGYAHKNGELLYEDGQILLEKRRG